MKWSMVAVASLASLQPAYAAAPPVTYTFEVLLRPGFSFAPLFETDTPIATGRMTFSPQTEEEGLQDLWGRSYYNQPFKAWITVGNKTIKVIDNAYNRDGFVHNLAVVDPPSTVDFFDIFHMLGYAQPVEYLRDGSTISDSFGTHLEFRASMDAIDNADASIENLEAVARGASTSPTTLTSFSLEGLTGDYRAYGYITNLKRADAVPETGLWSLLIVGFGVAGWSLRRRHHYVDLFGNSGSLASRV